MAAAAAATEVITMELDVIDCPVCCHPQRPPVYQGMKILLSADEHVLGRTVESSRFRISALAVSGKNCKIYRDTALEDLRRDEPVPVYLKDTSTNGTYINWQKFTNKSPPAKLNHGDIISFTTAPHNGS